MGARTSSIILSVLRTILCSGSMADLSWIDVWMAFDACMVWIDVRMAFDACMVQYYLE